MQIDFDPTAVEKRESNYDLLPAGWYDAQAIESEIIPLKSGNGTALKLTFDVLTDGYRGRRVWVRLNYRHSNPTAEKIAQQQLRELCESTGVGRLTDTTLLHHRPVSIKVRIREDKSGQYEPQNDVTGYKALGAMSPPASASRGFPAAPPRSMPPAASPAPTPAAAPAASTEAPAASSAPPWAKRAA